MAARAASLARRQAAPAVVYAASSDLFARGGPAFGVIYIYRQNRVADDLAYVFSRGNARPTPFNIPPTHLSAVRSPARLLVIREELNSRVSRKI